MVWTYEHFRTFRDGVIPVLERNGWRVDQEGPQVPNPFGGEFPTIRLRYRSPDGLYYGIKDALRVATGKTPRRPGVPNAPESQHETGETS